INLDGSWDADFVLNSSTNICTVGFGGTFSDANGNIYAYCNAGEFYQITPNSAYSNFTITQISTVTQSMTNNDGAGCPLSNGLETTSSDCCEQVLALLESLQTPDEFRADFTRLEEELYLLKEEQNEE